MTDFRTHWMRTVHDALCGLSAKRLPRGERIIGGECATADVTCLGCRAVLRLAAMDEATSDTDLRTLAQAVVDARKALWDGPCTVCEERGDNLEALRLAENALAALGAENDWVNGHEAAILAALDAAEAQGYARVMGEVVERCDASVSENA